MVDLAAEGRFVAVVLERHPRVRRIGVGHPDGLGCYLEE
jgi:hypothetical protein